MRKPVSLEEIADTLEMLSEGTEAFLVMETGEIILVTDDDRTELESSDMESIPEWQRDHLAKVRDILETGKVIPFPSSFDIHEWSIMERFSNTITDQDARDSLIDAIHGKGAFRMFRNTCERFHLRETWHAYRRSAYEEIAREWLQDNEITFT